MKHRLQSGFQNSFWFVGGLLSGLTLLSITRAAAPLAVDAITDDTAIYQNLSEIQVEQKTVVDVESGVDHLSQMEEQYAAHIK